MIGHDNYYTFVTDEPGVYYVKLVVNNRYGQVEDEVKITVTEPESTELPEIPEMGEWQFPWTEINVAQGRSIKVRAYMTGTEDEVSQVFMAETQGRYTLTLTHPTTRQQQEIVINVCPPAGTHRRPALLC